MIAHGAEINVDKPGQVLVVARDYGEYEEAEERPLIGPAGQLHDEVASYGGFRREDLNLTNVVPETRPPGDDFKRHRPEDVAAGRAALDKLVKRLKPKLIITMGNEAAYHFVPDWPTGGRDIFGAKGIEDRRGYFWESKVGWVYTILHPAGAARKIVPGYELLRRDWGRAKAWLQGKLPREEFPEVRTLSSSTIAQALLTNTALAFDIETRFGGKAFCCGFTGDSLQPYVAKYGQGFRWMREVLAGRKGLRGVAHNGQYDVDILDRDGFPTALYTDDTQTAWGNGLEPELAFHDEEDKGRLTRKGLASIATIGIGGDHGLNVPWWKSAWHRPEFPDWVSGYPPEDSDDPNDLALLYVMAGRDSYVTRRRWDALWKEVQHQHREPQYRLAFETNLRCITMTRRGWPIDEKLRVERMQTLHARAEEAKALSAKAALAYIEEHQIEDFKKTKQCACCNGAGSRCWRCAGLPAMPKRKIEYLGAKARTDGTSFVIRQEHLDATRVSDLKDFLPPCRTCRGNGKTSRWVFNPFSRDQLSLLLYQHVGAPQWVFKGKTHMDEMATIRLLLWSSQNV
jgi:uracil-DNA glycosylase family 4